MVTRRYNRSVTDFLAGNRCAGRYLLTLSEGLTALGLAGTVANFEKFYEAGFAASWWGTMMMPLGMIIALSGWVSYRYRETRAMTMAQFFEMRYSRRFRIFAGIVAWVSGVLNFGIFPSITARFLISFCGLPPVFHLPGVAIPSFPAVMAAMLGITLVLTLSGGMVTVMICDFLQAQFINIAFLVVMVVMFHRFSWSTISTTLQTAPAGKSLINPFDQGGISDFNVWFFMIFAFKLFYNRLGWQGTQGYNCAAKSPHEAKMAGILAEWRGGVTYLIIMLIPICAYVLLHSPQFAGQAQAIRDTIQAIPDAQLQKQMTVPIALVHMLPAGVVGILCAAMIGATVGNDTTYLHAWGSILIQDVVLPFRKEPLSPKRHMRLLRLSVFGVAAFAFCFSLIFPLRDFIYMYMLITGAVYLGGAGAVIIGGLYWKRGTTAGAWTAMITGGTLATGGAVLRLVWPRVPALVRHAPQFPLNGAWVALMASLAAIVVYIGVSLMTCRQPFDMDRLLHRGRFALPGEHRAPVAVVRDWRKLIGITQECTRGDRLIYYLKVGWTAFWLAAFVLGTVLGLTIGISNAMWMKWWTFTIVLGATVGAVTIGWFLWGGTRDLRRLLLALRAASRDLHDDGTVPAEPDGARAPRV